MAGGGGVRPGAAEAALARPVLQGLLREVEERARRSGVVTFAGLLTGAAALLAEGLRVEHRVSEDVAEIDLGRWEGRAWEEIERREPTAFAEYMRDWLSAAPHGGETPGDVEVRVRQGESYFLNVDVGAT